MSDDPDARLLTEPKLEDSESELVKVPHDARVREVRMRKSCPNEENTARCGCSVPDDNVACLLLRS
jgi:hypothetical protein